MQQTNYPEAFDVSFKLHLTGYSDFLNSNSSIFYTFESYESCDYRIWKNGAYD
jgi:hypothetical protein